MYTSTVTAPRDREECRHKVTPAHLHDSAPRRTTRSSLHYHRFHPLLKLLRDLIQTDSKSHNHRTTVLHNKPCEAEKRLSP
ncbi:UNVERIFIED_CONTAM: hypothetical protein FKN15_030100 [Acipenser sinensis]